MQALPDALLTLCLPIDPKNEPIRSVATYMRCCKRFLQLFLRGTSYGSLRLRIWRRGLQHSLPLYESLLKLEVAVAEDSTEADLANLLSPPAEDVAAATWPHSITNLRIIRSLQNHTVADHKLHNAVLTQLVPACIAKASPGLEGLQYHHTNFQSGAGQAPTALPDLQRLELQHCQQLPDLEHLRRQLQALPSLTQFSYLPDMGWYQPDDPPNMCMAIAEVLSSKLTHLCMYLGEDVAAFFDPTRCLLASWYPVLQRLNLPGAAIDDSMLTGILRQMPQLAHIEVGVFQLEEDYSKAPCSWQKAYMGCVTLQSLALLPLCSATDVGFAPSVRNPVLRLAKRGGDMNIDSNLTAKAVAAMQQCGGLRWPHSEGDQEVAVQVERLPQPGQLLQACRPLILQLRAMVLRKENLTCALLKELGKLPALRTRTICEGCQVQHEAWSTMVSLLPQVHTMRFVGYKTSPSARIHLQMWAFVGSIKRPMTVCLEHSEWDQIAQERFWSITTRFQRPITFVFE